MAAETTYNDSAPQKPRGGSRIALWDNARFLLIVLVVIGHLIGTARDDGAAVYGVYAGIYLFHMPAMILLSGVFAKPEVNTKAVISTTQLLATWLVWEGIWFVLNLFGDGEGPGQGLLISQAWTLWFLVSLATMRIIFPYIARLRYPLTTSVVIALLAGVSPTIGAEFSASRTLCLLPFFVLGWQLRERGWSEQPWLARPTMRVRAIAWAGIAAVVVAFFALPDLRNQWDVRAWTLWKDHYGELFATAAPFGFVPEDLGTMIASGMAIRLALLTIAAGLTLALLIVTPRGTSRMTAWGAQTLTVYLLHAPVVWALRKFGVVDALGEWGIWGLAILIAISVVIAIVFSTRTIARLFGPITTPRIDWLFTR